MRPPMRQMRKNSEPRLGGDEDRGRERAHEEADEGEDGVDGTDVVRVSRSAELLAF